MKEHEEYIRYQQMLKQKRIDMVIRVVLFIAAAIVIFMWMMYKSTSMLNNIWMIMVISMIFMFLTNVYSNVYTIGLFTAVFVAHVVIQPESAYLMSVYLPSIILTELFSGTEYEHKSKVMARFLVGYYIVVLVVTFAISLLFTWSEDETSTFWGVLTASLTIAAMQTVGPVMLISMNRWLKRGMDYLRKFTKLKNRQQKRVSMIASLKASKLSWKIVTLIAAEAVVLCLAGAWFSNSLLPSMGNVLEGSDGTDVSFTILSADEDEDTDSQLDLFTLLDEFRENYRNDDNDTGEYTFVYNLAALVFDIKLILMLINAAIPVILFANIYAQGRMVRPIKQMSEAMRDFSEHSREDRQKYATKVAKLNVVTHDEIEDLYTAVNDTVQEVSGYIDWMQKEQTLQNELEVEKKANEAKGIFLSSMSHELRTPLNAILGLSEMILRETKDKDMVKYAVDIKTSGNTLLSLINDVLDSTKMEAGKMEIIPVDYDMSSVLNDLTHMVSERAKAKGLEVKVEVDEKMPYLLHGDEIRLKQVITNLLTNAVKYTEEGSVTLSMSHRRISDEELALIVHVKDTGIGIKQEDIEKLFIAFQRIEEERNRTIEGTGLGMNIVKTLLGLMDSELQVESVYGEGSDFSFELKQGVVDEKPIGDYTLRYEESLASMMNYTESFRAPSAKIMVVDDTETNLVVIKNLLKSTQVQVETATSGFELLDKVKETKYDIIFLDHRMPKMDGLETFDEMKKLEGNLNADTPCIALTANAFSGARETYIDHGFQDYLSKPIDAGKLELMIHEYLPEDKIEICDDKEKVQENAYTDVEQDFITRLKRIDGVNVDEAIKNCGAVETLQNVAESVYENAGDKIELIESYCRLEDWKEYTVQVHALKSSARLLGATQLSMNAAYLETCGNEQNAEEIKSKTPTLLDDYKALYQALDGLFAPDEQTEDERELIDEAQLMDAYGAIKELLTADDFDNAMGVYEMLKEYRVDEAHAETYRELGKALKGLDRETALNLLS